MMSGAAPLPLPVRVQAWVRLWQRLLAEPPEAPFPDQDPELIDVDNQDKAAE